MYRLLCEHVFLVDQMIIVQLLEELPDCFPKQVQHFTFALAMLEGSTCSASLSIVFITCLFANSHPGEYEVVFYCGFNLPFPNG